MALAPKPRHRRGEVRGLVYLWLKNQAQPGTRYTPYAIARQMGLSPGSVTAACKALVKADAITHYGDSPFMVGRRD